MIDTNETLSTDDSDSFDFEAHYARAKRIGELLLPFCAGGKVHEWRGHLRSGEDFGGWYTPEKRLQEIVRESFDFCTILSEKDALAFESAIAGGVLLETPIPIPGRRELTCHTCGQYLILGFNGVGFVVTGEGSPWKPKDKPCPYPNGIITEYELNVPSGKIVVANDLREWFPSEEDYSVNEIIGRHLTTLAYAKVGMAHGCVGNTCPGVFRDGPNFVIGLYRDEVYDEEEEEYRDNPNPCPWGERVAGVCTDLWWFSIADHDEFLRRIEYYAPDADRDNIFRFVDTVDVKPGVYKFRQDHNADHDADAVVLTSFEWVREADPMKDFVGGEREKDLGATEILIQQCLSWPSLYLSRDIHDDPERGEGGDRWRALTYDEKVHCLARAADSALCTLSSARDWHENGFPRTSVSEEAKQLAAEFGDIPSFNFQTHWYPISAGYGGLCLGAGVRSSHTKDREVVPLSPDFVRLALNICQNAITYGEKPRLTHDVWPPAYEIPYCQERMKLFAQCYHGLRERYPAIVFDSAFDERMRTLDIDAYVDSFDFGPKYPEREDWWSEPITVKTGDFFEFDATKLKDGHFCWHPRYMKGWAKKEDAQRYCLHVIGDTMSPMGHLHMKETGCGVRDADATVPLRVVGRVVRGTGEGYNSLELEVAFDYGTKDMRTERWAIRKDDMRAVRQFDDADEYARLLEECKVEFDDAETKVAALVAAKGQ